MKNKNFKEYINIFFELIKIRITVSVWLTTVLGYILVSGSLNTPWFIPTFGLFLIACGSAALNQYQESDIDPKMERTAKRPLPTGKISKPAVLTIILTLFILGSVLLYFGSNFIALMLGFSAILWYNGIYTPLKRKTPFAVIPGALIGAIPPVVGWAAAGGNVLDLKIIYLAFFFFIWQIPHFWLLLLKFGKDYEKAGLPSLSSVYSTNQLKKITYIWIISLALFGMIIPIFHIINYHLIIAFLLIASVLIIIYFTKNLLYNKKELKLRAYFGYVNLYILVIILLISTDALI